MPPSWSRSARDVGRLCLFAAPTMVQRLVEHVAASGAPCDGFKTIVYGGGPMYGQDIRRALATMGPRFVQIYGQGESPMTITALSRAHLADDADPRWPERIASVGVAQALVEVRVVDADGSDARDRRDRRGRRARRHGDGRATGATRRRRRRRCATAGCSPATSARSTATAS